MLAHNPLMFASGKWMIQSISIVCKCIGILFIKCTAITHKDLLIVLGSLNPPGGIPTEIHTDSSLKECRFKCWKSPSGSFITTLDWVQLVSIPGALIAF